MECVESRVESREGRSRAGQGRQEQGRKTAGRGVSFSGGACAFAALAQYVAAWWATKSKNSKIG